MTGSCTARVASPNRSRAPPAITERATEASAWDPISSWAVHDWPEGSSSTRI